MTVENSQCDECQDEFFKNEEKIYCFGCVQLLRDRIKELEKENEILSEAIDEANKDRG